MSYWKNKHVNDSLSTNTLANFMRTLYHEVELVRTSHSPFPVFDQRETKEDSLDLSGCDFW